MVMQAMCLMKVTGLRLNQTIRKEHFQMLPRIWD